MRHYEVKALRADRQIIALDYAALDEGQAIMQARRDGFEVLMVRARPWQFRLARPFRFPLVLFSQELRTLINAGLPLLDALKTLAEKERSREIKNVLDKLAVTVSEGNSFSRALYVATVSASERTGDLGPALQRYVSYQQQLDEIKKKVVNALIYPSLLFVVGGLVSLFLLTYVVPKFAHIYEDRGTSLSWSSQLMVQWGNLLEGRGMMVLLIIATVIGGTVYLLRTQAVKRALLKRIRRIPALGERLRIYQLTRFYRTASMLLRSGIPLVAAFEMSAGMLHADLRPKLDAALQTIREGRTISHTLEAQGLTTPVAVRMLSVGEQGGNMGEMMEQAAAFHDEEIARWVEWFSRMFEPLLMAVIGVVIGGIVVAMYLPIFELVGEVH
jgi:general secretion pathway protein F